MKTLLAVCIAFFYVMHSPAVVTTADGDPNTNAPTFGGGYGANSQATLCDSFGIKTSVNIINTNKVLKSAHVRVAIGNTINCQGTNFVITNIIPCGKLHMLEVLGTFPAGTKAVINTDTNEFGVEFVTWGCSGPKGAVITTSNLLGGPCLYLTNFTSCGPTNSFRVVGGRTGTRFSVQKTTDFVTWTAVGEFTYTMTSSHWLDISICGSNEPIAFYRTVCPTLITNGWRMNGVLDGKLRWGMNRFEPELDNEGMLTSRFNLGAGPHEAAAWSKDSSGGDYAEFDGVVKLTGINEYSFTSKQYQTETGEVVQGVICDESGLIDSGFLVPFDDGPSAPIQCGHVRISDYAEWLEQFTQ